MGNETTPFERFNKSGGYEIGLQFHKDSANSFDTSTDDILNFSTENTSQYDEYNYYTYYYFEIYSFEILALGLVQPILVLAATVSNIFVSGFFLRKKTRKKGTSVLFVSIAFSDTMTGVTLLPNAFGVYATDHTEMSMEWCNAYMMLRFYVSPVFHTVSVWQTVLLCIQRYLCVCHPFISGRICTFWKTLISIAVMYCAAMLMHSYHLADNKLSDFIMCRWEIETPCKESCVYLWICIVLEHLFPCILLVILTIITLQGLWKAQRRVAAMARRRISSRSNRDKIITNTAALIVLFFLIPELPHGIYKLVFVIFKHAGNFSGMSVFSNRLFISVYELALTVSFCANFWIYCCMMRDFRQKLVTLFFCRIFKRGFARLRLLSDSSKNESFRTTFSRSSAYTSRNRVLSKTTSLPSTESENVHLDFPLTTIRGFDNEGKDEKIKDDVFDDNIND